MDATETQNLAHFRSEGWIKFPVDPAVKEWANYTLPVAKACMKDIDNQHWWRYQRTWFVGVNVLPNDQAGQLRSGPPLKGRAVEFICALLNTDMRDLDAAQISAIMPGYPKPTKTNNEPGFQYRIKRDAAHVDGLLKLGDNGERYAMEYHQYILAIPLNTVSKAASPLTLWSGSHVLMRENLGSLLHNTPIESWPSVPVNSAYQSARREVFDKCERIEMPLKPGEALLLDRHLLHGTAPWTAPVYEDIDGRIIAFFRPQFEMPSAWLETE